MDKRFIALVSAAAAVSAVGSVASAAPNPSQDVLRVSSYADLLTPIPNAPAVLHELDSAHNAHVTERKQVAQYYYHDHHHHHSNFYRRYRGYDGYHHHHHSNYYRRGRDSDGYGHHHHHNSYYRY